MLEITLGLPAESIKSMSWTLATSKKSWCVDSTMCSASLSADPVFISKYDDTVAIKPFRKWRESQRGQKYDEREDSNHCFAIRFGLVGGVTILRIVILMIPTVVYWKGSKKGTKLTTVVLAIYADRVLLVLVVIALVVVLEIENHYGCHVTLKGMRLS